MIIINDHLRLIEKAGVISARKLDEFMGWYPIMKRRSDEGSDVGPDAIAIERQLQEVKVTLSCSVYVSRNLVRCFGMDFLL